MRPDYCPLWNEPCQKGCEPKCGTLNAWEKLRTDNGRLRAALKAVRDWDVSRAIDNLKLSGSVDFALPQAIREQVQSALNQPPNTNSPTAESD